MRTTAPLLLLAAAALLPAGSAPAPASEDDFAEARRAVEKAMGEKDPGALADALWGLRKHDGEPAARLLLSAAFRREGTPDFVLDAACDALAEFQGDGAAEVLAKELAKTRDDGRPILLEALGRLRSARAEEALVAAAEDRDPRFRTAAVRALADRKAPLQAARAAAERACLDPDPRVRSAGIAALSAWKGIPGALPLLGRIEAEKGRLYGDAWRGLVGIAGREIPPDPARWAEWWRTQPGEEKWAFEAAPRAPSPSVLLAGLRSWSRRVVFALDTSDGMADRPGYRPEDLVPPDVKAAGGKALEEWMAIRTRLDHARCHLARAIEGLPEDASFEVVFGAETSGALFGAPEPATAAAKERATGRLRGLNAKDRQDFLRLLRTALSGSGEADPVSAKAFAGGPDTVVYVGTALPSYGAELDPGRVVSSVRRWNRVRQVQFLCVGVGTHGSGLLADLSSISPTGASAAIR